MAATPSADRLELASQRGVLWRNGDPVRLQPRQTAILTYLTRRRLRLVTHGELAECGWGRRGFSVATVRMEIHRLRRLIGAAGIETVFGLGYRLVGDIRELGAPVRTGKNA